MIRVLSRLQPWGITFIRLVLGASMLVHGTEKLIPPGGLQRAHLLAGADHFAAFTTTLGLPHFLGYISVATEFLGGIFLLLGLLTRLCAFFVTINMLVALILVNLHKGYSASEYTLALIVMAFLLILTGSGALSIDRRLGLA